MMADRTPSEAEDQVESDYASFERSLNDRIQSDDGDMNPTNNDVSVEMGVSDDVMIDNNPDAAKRSSRAGGRPNAIARLQAGIRALFFDASLETLVFSSRICVSVTIASLFLLAFPTSDPWPDSVWIVFTCIFVTWQPSIDAGTAFKKFIERFIGTVLGASLAFGVGYVSLAVGTTQDQAVFLGFVIALESFLYPYLADHLGYRSTYGALVGNLTFAIAIFAFYDPKADPPWFVPLYRCLNVLIGCVIGGLVSVAVYPVSTRTFLISNVHKLIVATGKNADMTLQAAAEAFDTGRKPMAISVLLKGVVAGSTVADPVHATYVKNLEGWKNCRALVPILRYDPWFWLMPLNERIAFKHAMTMLAARTFRIQMNIVLLDSIVRSDAEYKGPMEAIRLLPPIGSCVRTALNVKDLEPEARKAAVQELLEVHLPLIRERVIQASSQLSASGCGTLPDFAHLESVLLAGPSTVPFSILNQQGGQTLLFFQLIEQLILRVAKLHFCLRQYQPLTLRKRFEGCGL